MHCSLEFENPENYHKSCTNILFQIEVHFGSRSFGGGGGSSYGWYSFFGFFVVVAVNYLLTLLNE